MKTSIEKPYEVQLDLETSLGSPIENQQHTQMVPNLDTENLRQSFNRRFPNRLVERTKNGTNFYNCHGLVFASRRTRIFSSDTVRKILKDDAYARVADNDVKPGDIVLYVHKGAIDHSAVVVDVQTSDLPNIRSIKVFSKWGKWCEVIHGVLDCDWAQEPETLIEYYRVER